MSKCLYKFEKVLFVMIIVLFMIAGIVQTNTVYASERKEGDFGTSLHWKLEDGTLTISGTGFMPNYSVGVWVQNGAPWYEDRYEIQKTIIETGVTSIGDQAFLCCRNMKSIELPNTITHIGTSAFEDCNALLRLELNEGITSLGTNIIKSTNSDLGGVEYIRIPSTIKVMPEGCIGRTYNLKTIEFMGDAPAISTEGIFGEYFTPSEITLVCKEDAEGFDASYWNSFKEIVKSGKKTDGNENQNQENPSDLENPEGDTPSGNQEKVPGPVVLKSVKCLSRHSARITWKKAINADGYYIYKKSGKKYVKIAVIKNSKATSYKVKKLKRGKKYTFTVQAFKNVGKNRVLTGIYDKVGLRVKIKK